MLKKIYFVLIFQTLGLLCMAQGFENFITVSGNKLMDGDKEFRFLSFNIPNLNFIEDELEFTRTLAFKLPTEFEIRDALTTIKQMGGRVVRIYTIPVKRSEQPDQVPASVLGPGIFNEEAFKANDLMLAIANEVGIRIIFPIVNNWKWMGGRPQYAGFRGKTQDEFWTDKQCIDDVKKTIEYTLNRTNTITGIKYKDDKAILCWETGNELFSPIEWTRTMCSYIKEIDPNHLTMDGVTMKDRVTARKESLDEPSIDIITTHHYETDPLVTFENIMKNLKIIDGRKPYIVGEFGFQSTESMRKLIDYMISDHDIAGAMTWSIRFHREDGGFYWHSEPFGHGLYKAYHWPGFASGEAYDEINLLKLFYEKAYEFQGLERPEPEIPASPKLLDISNIYTINWQGSAGARYYDAERAEKKDGPWITVGKNISDANVQYTPLFQDETAQLNKEYFYRIIAKNYAGKSKPSNIVGPVKFNEKALVDNMNNFGKTYFTKDITIKTGDDRKFKEDKYRMAGDTTSEIIYYVPGKIVVINVYSFDNTGGALYFKVSANCHEFVDIPTEPYNYYEKNNDYKAWQPVKYTLDNIDTGYRFIKILFRDECQISRVVIEYK